MPNFKFLKDCIYTIYMSKTFGFSMNKSEILFLCNKYDCLEHDLGKTMKALHLEKTNSFNYPIQFMEDFKEAVIEEKNKIEPKKITSHDLEKMGISELNKYIKDVKEKELRQFVGLTKKNSKNAIDEKGLYGGVNLERYIQKFTDNWNRNFEIIPELLNRVTLITKEEMIMKEIQMRNLKK